MEKIINKKIGAGLLATVLLFTILTSTVPMVTADPNPGNGPNGGGKPANPGTKIDCNFDNPILGGVIDGNVKAPDGQTCIIRADSDIEINGDVVAGIGTELHISTYLPGVTLTINGDVKTDGGDKVRITGITENRVTITGSVQIKNTLNGIKVTQADILGSAQFDSNQEYYSITNSYLGNSVQVKYNVATIQYDYFNNFSGNEIDGNLQCSKNDPAPVALLFGLNTVDGKSQGQCSGLEAP